MPSGGSDKALSTPRLRAERELELDAQKGEKANYTSLLLSTKEAETMRRGVENFEQAIQLYQNKDLSNIFPVKIKI